MTTLRGRRPLSQRIADRFGWGYDAYPDGTDFMFASRRHSHGYAMLEERERTALIGALLETMRERGWDNVELLCFDGRWRAQFRRGDTERLRGRSQSLFHAVALAIDKLP